MLYYNRNIIYTKSEIPLGLYVFEYMYYSNIRIVPQIPNEFIIDNPRYSIFSSE